MWQTADRGQKLAGGEGQQLVEVYQDLATRVDPLVHEDGLALLPSRAGRGKELKSYNGGITVLYITSAKQNWPRKAVEVFQ